jgi:type I restriction enzyme M protein
MDFQNIDGIIKSCRDLMRKDKGMNTDAQRIPQLLWMLFLKCFDDFELQKEILGDYTSLIEEPYRWRDWTSDEKGRRGDELIDFVNGDLFKYLSNLHGEGAADQRDVIADVFREQKNFMTDGYGMNDLMQQINKLDFTSSEQFHLIGSVYEKMLSSMKDDSPGTFGEFYTPRPVIKFMVNTIKPSLKKRETILDPACGTAGFLIESYNHLVKNVKGTPDNDFLQKQCLSGIEPRPEPYLFSMMNMMLHGIEEPNIARVNTLETKLSDIKENLQHNIILTNPPFGGEEQDSIKNRLPAGYQTKDTAVGFLLHCMKRLKQGGRCGIILPDGAPLSSGTVYEKIRKKLLEEFNLHTIIRLPRSIFAPYTDYATNILFFEDTGPTKEIWYYKMNIPDRIIQIGIDKGRKIKDPKFNKTNPIKDEDFESIEKWYKNKKESQHAWMVKVVKEGEDTYLRVVDKDGVHVEDKENYILDISNPNDKKDIVNLSLHENINQIVENEKRVLILMKEIQQLINHEIPK